MPCTLGGTRKIKIEREIRVRDPTFYLIEVKKQSYREGALSPISEWFLSERRAWAGRGMNEGSLRSRLSLHRKPFTCLSVLEAWAKPPWTHCPSADWTKNCHEISFQLLFNFLLFWWFYHMMTNWFKFTNKNVQIYNISKPEESLSCFKTILPIQISKNLNEDNTYCWHGYRETHIYVRMSLAGS